MSESPDRIKFFLGSEDTDVLTVDLNSLKSRFSTAATINSDREHSPLDDTGGGSVLVETRSATNDPSGTSFLCLGTFCRELDFERLRALDTTRDFALLEGEIPTNQKKKRKKTSTRARQEQERGAQREQGRRQKKNLRRRQQDPEKKEAGF